MLIQVCTVTDVVKFYNCSNLLRSSNNRVYIGQIPFQSVRLILNRLVISENILRRNTALQTAYSNAEINNCGSEKFCKIFSNIDSMFCVLRLTMLF